MKNKTHRRSNHVFQGSGDVVANEVAGSEAKGNAQRAPEQGRA